MALEERTSALRKFRQLIDGLEAKKDELDERDADIWIPRLQTVLTKFENAHDQLVDASEPDSPEEDEHVALGRKITEEGDSWLKRFASLKSRPASCASLPSTIISPRSDAQLEKVSLPKFDGQQKNWLQFRDVYLPMVHNTDQADAMKLIRLRQLVDANKVSAVSGSYVGSYNEIWEELCARYDDNRKLIASHCGELSRLPLNPPESKAAIQRVVDATRAMLRAMQYLNKCTRSWDPIL